MPFVLLWLQFEVKFNKVGRQVRLEGHIHEKPGKLGRGKFLIGSDLNPNKEQKICAMNRRNPGRTPISSTPKILH